MKVMEPRRKVAPRLSSLGPTARFVAAPGAELLLSILPVVDRDGRQRITDGELWANRADVPALRAARRTLERIGREPIINLLGVAIEAVTAGSARALLDHLRGLEPAELVLNMVGGYRRTIRRGTPPDVIRAAVAGDAAARRSFLETSMPEVENWQASLENLLATPPKRTAERTLTALEAWYDHAFAAEEDRISDAQAREVAQREREGPPRSAEAWFGRLAPGIDYQVPPEVDDVVFVPTFVVRPAIVFLDHRTTTILAFPVTEERTGSEPPVELVRLGKALGDELRLRALRALADGPRTLGDLAIELGVPRTSLSHHLGVLRAAGLVSLTIEDGRWGRLRLQVDAADDLPSMLREYVHQR